MSKSLVNWASAATLSESASGYGKGGLKPDISPVVTLNASLGQWLAIRL